MKNAKFIALVESILEEKKVKMLRALLESNDRKRLSEESDEVAGDEIHDGLQQGDDNPDISGVGSSGGGAGSTDAARKADGADTAQADIAHLEEEDDGQLDIDSFLTAHRDGEDVVKLESDCGDDDYLEEGDEEEEGEDEETVEEDAGMEEFFEEFDDFESDIALDDPISEAKKAAAKKKTAAKKPVKKKR